MKELVTVFVSGNNMEAQQIRSVLEGSEVDALILDQHFAALNLSMAGPLGGVKVVVPADQVERVRDIFRDVLNENGNLPLIGKSFHPYTDVFRRIAGSAAAPEPAAPLTCASCKSDCEPDSNFCDQCGAAFSQQAA